MLRFITRRLLEMIPVLFVIATLTFFMLRAAPGGPFDREKRLSKEVKANMEKHYGLDKPLWEQYVMQMSHLVRGDLGPSYKYANRSVNELIAAAFPVSLELGFWSLLVALTFGLLAGVLAAVKQNTFLDYLPMSSAMIGICFPTFVTGPILILIFALNNDWFNASGWFFPRDRILPALTLGAYYAAYVARLGRGGMLEVLHQDFIRTAKAKGAAMPRIVFKHALRAGILPVVSFLGPAVAGLITGSFVVETIFQIPGLGRYFVTSVFNRDFTMVIGTTLFYVTLIMVLNLIVDLLQILLNPKVRIE